MEHRWGQRIEVNVTARVSDISGSQHVARIADLSVSGAFLKISLPVSELRPIYVDLGLALQKRSDTVEAYVVRRTSEGVGIEWAQMGSDPVLQLLSAFQPSREMAGVVQVARRQSG